MTAILPSASASPAGQTPVPLTDRYDIVVLIEAAMVNPNGDPDNGNQPRQDPVTGTGIITPVSLKRKLRDYLAAVRGASLYHANGVVLREQRADALTKNGITPSGEEEPEEAPEGEKKKTRRGSGREAVTGADLRRNQQVICGEYWDARTFGALMDTGAARAANARGPVTVSSALSVDPIRIIEHSITRQSVEKVEEGRKDKDREMGSVSVVRYGLYQFDVTVHPFHAQNTGFTTADLALLRDALVNAFEFDQSSNRRLTLRGIFAFRHESTNGKPCLGRAPRASLIERVAVMMKEGVEEPLSFRDYIVAVNDANLPEGVKLEHWA